MEHLNRLTAFRQALYEKVLTKRRDAQQELLDAMLLSPSVHAFAELCLCPAFKRSWSSLYKALEKGEQDEKALRELIVQQIPDEPVIVFPIDESAWPRPDAPTLKDRGFVHSASAAIDGAGIVIGHSYSVLAYVAEPESSWTLPVSTRRVSTSSSAVRVGVEQIQELCRLCADKAGLKVITADGRYGNHRFLGAFPREITTGRLALLVRLRSDRVLFGAPGPYSGRGRPRKHGAAFRFKDKTTWPDPQQQISFTDPRYGVVKLRLWQHLHTREDAQTPFSVLCAEIHLERENPPKPLWLAWVGPSLAAEQIWSFYPHRASIEASFRFRKQYLWWTLPHLETIEASERWTRLVTIAQWTLFLSKDLVRDAPQPWQKPQVRLTPERVKQSLGGLFSQIDTQAKPPKNRGKSPGWPVGRRRRRRDRHPVVCKSAQKTLKASVRAIK